jgi:hypothetical protein
MHAGGLKGLPDFCGAFVMRLKIKQP